jgi:hypothetical protein
VGLALALLHLGLGGWLVLGLQHGTVSRAPGSAPTSFQAIAMKLAPVRLLAAQPLRRGPLAPELDARAAQRVRPLPSKRSASTPTRAAPEAIALPRQAEAADAAPTHEARQDALPASSAPLAPLAPPLDLRLPTRSPTGSPATVRTPAQQAVEARVGGARKSTPEERMGRRLETTWTEERLDDGRVRLRRGDDCAILSEARAAQIDPWNNRGTAPRGAGACPPP